MPSKFIVKSFFVSIVGLFLGYASMNILVAMNTSTKSEQFERTIASSPITKIGIDQIARDYFDIKITNQSVAVKNDEASVIQVIVTALKPLPVGLQYKWQLHKDMSSTDPLTGQLEDMAAGAKKEFTLRVTGFSKQINSHINFVIFGQIGEHNLRRSVITSSRPEDSFEYVVEQAALNEKKTGQIQKLSNGKSVKKKFDPSKVIK